MNHVLFALVMLGILAPLLSAWITAIDRREQRAVAAKERASRHPDNG